jgi:adenylylsulfate kinase
MAHHLTWQHYQKESAPKTTRNPLSFWMTGLSGSGKSSLAQALYIYLTTKGKQVIVLDGDNIRHGLCKDLGFSEKDRSENIRRISEVAKLFNDTGIDVICAFISPFQNDRIIAKQIVGDAYKEIFIKCSLAECQKRDPKGLYQKAKDGLISNFTGIDSPYETPETPDIVIDTEHLSIESSLQRVIATFGI